MLAQLYGRQFNYQRTGISVRDGGCYFDKVGPNSLLLLFQQNDVMRFIAFV